MAKGTKKQKQRWECGHRGFGKYCHYCKDVAAGRVAKRQRTAEGAGEPGAPVEMAKPKTWKRAKCPFCGGSRVKKNEINVFSPVDVKEYACTSWDCGKQFNSEQVKEYEEVEVRERKKVGGDPRRLTD
ncbi:MAG: hypothetical protein HYY16_19815 [Planctomycetes bacterium]|nr:hypothetical protein [Planctomycetota bacterium]